MDDSLLGYQYVESASPPWHAPATGATHAAHPAGAMSLSILESVLNEIDYGVMVIRSGGTLLLANQLAQAELDTSSYIKLRSDKLSARSAKHALAIEHALLDAANGQRRLLQIPSAGGSLSLSFAPLDNQHDFAHAAESTLAPLVLVLIGKPVAGSAAALAEFGQIHGLTRAEQRLLPAICQGASIKDMAKQQHVSSCTVRIQLKNIRDKTGAASLRPLMLQLTTLPPLRSPRESPSAH